MSLVMTTACSYNSEDVVKDGYVLVKTNVLGGIFTVIPTANCCVVNHFYNATRLDRMLRKLKLKQHI